MSTKFEKQEKEVEKNLKLNEEMKNNLENELKETLKLTESHKIDVSLIKKIYFFINLYFN